MQRVVRVLVVMGIVVLALGAGLVGGVFLDRQLTRLASPVAASTGGSGVDVRLITQAWDTINQVYVDRPAVQSQRLTYAAIDGMVSALGDTGHSRFLTPEMLQQENNAMEGSFEGIGAEVEEREGHAVIVTPLDSSPAQKAGVRPGDIILKVDGQDMTGLPLHEVVSHVLGPAGTQVTITFQDPQTGATRDITIVRARIVLQNVTWQKIPGTTYAHVRVATFSQGVSPALRQALSDIEAQGITGIVLDLRNDPGGLLQEAVGVTSSFLSSGDVMQEKDAHGDVKSISVDTGVAATTLRVVVLVNQGTASAAEIVAGALQDAGRGKVVGETTFGTGTVLNEFRLSDGSALLLATQEWLTPKGRVIWHQGIVPEVPVVLPASTLPLTPEAERQMTTEQIQASGDAQLLKAIELLGQ